MSRYLKVYFVIALLAAFLFTAQAAFAWPKDEIIIIGGDNNYPPYEYVDEEGVYRGFNVDIMKAIALQVGIEISFRPMSWVDAQIALLNGEIHAIQGMTNSAEREEKYLFSEPYVTNSQAIFVLKEQTYPISLADLKGRRVAVQRDDISHVLLSKMSGIQMEVRDNQEEALGLLLAGKVDAFVGNRLTGSYLIQKNNKAERIKIIGEKIEPTYYGAAVAQGNEELLQLFNTGIAKIRETGVYDEIYKKWFGEEIQQLWNTFLLQVLYAISGLLAMALGGALVVSHWNRGLKKEVAKRTFELARVNDELTESKNIIAERERFKEQILDSLYVGLLTLDCDGKLTSVNLKGREFLQLKETDLGSHYRELPIKDVIAAELIEDTLGTGQSHFDNEIKFPRLNEEVTWEYNIFPLLSPGNQVTGAVVNLKDVTQMKKLQESLARQDKMKSLGRLVAGIAHELRNPLTAIKTFVELIPVKLENPRFREKLVQYVPMEIERLNNLVKDLLEYAKPRQPRQELCQIKPVIEDVAHLFHQQLRDKGVNLSLDIEPGLEMFVDKQQLKQIVINLVLNGVEAIGESGQITITGARYQEKAGRLVIADNGVGISNDDFARLFDPFYTNKKEGTGLGLAIVYQYTKDNGGDIWLESKVGQGTSVYLEFPTERVKEVG